MRPNSRFDGWVAPTTLQGKLLRRVASKEDTWERLNLRDVPVTSVPAPHRTPQYVHEFTNGRRTLDPTFPAADSQDSDRKTRSVSKGATLNDLVRNSYSKDALGNVSKPVVISGKVAYSNATSPANILFTGSPQRYRGKPPLVSSSEYVQPISRKQSASGALSRQSQIETIPGPHRSTTLRELKKKANPMQKTTLAREEGSDKGRTETLTLLQRCTMTSDEDWSTAASCKRRGGAPPSTISSLLQPAEGLVLRSDPASSQSRVKPRPLVATDLFASSIEIA